MQKNQEVYNANLWDFEKVLVCDITNAIAGERGSGVIAVQGAAPRLSATGNCVIIMSFEVAEVADKRPTRR